MDRASSQPSRRDAGVFRVVGGRMLTVNRSNGVNTTYGYDSAGRLNNIAHSNGAAVIDEYAYVLDGNGNRTQVTTNAGTETYTLDDLNRITNATYPGGLTETFAYDPAGNRTSHTTPMAPRLPTPLMTPGS